MKLDLDALDNSVRHFDQPLVHCDDLAALVLIARAAVAWVNSETLDADVNEDLYEAVRDAGL